MAARAVYSLLMAIDNGTVLVLITVAVVPVAAIEPEAAPRKPPPAHVERALQEAEARQMIEARSYRRMRSGQPPLDVEAEVRQPLEGSGEHALEVDDELREEVRRLVVVRNERRLRQGEEALDVEAETERQLADFIGSG
jgi:hypothetical protein